MPLEFRSKEEFHAFIVEDTEKMHARMKKSMEKMGATVKEAAVGNALPRVK
jgi:ActR/RegA family two-component response regulator